MSYRVLLLLLLLFSKIGHTQYHFQELQKIKIPTNNLLPQIVKSVVSPDNAKLMMVSVYGWNAENRSAETNTYVSFDGGNTYQMTLRDNSTQWVSEVSNAFGVNGNCYVVTGASKRSGRLRGHPYGQLHLFHSSDGGITWTDTLKSHFMDWTSAVVDNSNGKYKGRLYISAYDIANDSGGWIGPQKPLIYSADKGTSISQPLFTGKWPEDGGGYPIASKVSTNGHLYILYKKSNPNTLVIGKSEDGGKTLKLLPPVPKDSLVGQRNIFESGIDLDRNGRMYIAYSAVFKGKNAVLLAYSDDEGISWKHRIVHYFDTPDKGELGSVSLSVSIDGTIGILWNEPSNQSYWFASSVDRGASFRDKIMVNSHNTFELTNSQFLENHLQTMGTFEPDQNAEEKRANTGLSVRFLPFSYAASISSDTIGNFHLYWTEQKTDGTPCLFSTTIKSNASKRDKKYQQIDTGRLVNINDKIYVDIQHQQFDAGTGTIVLDFTMTNKSNQILYGPLYVELDKIITGYGFVDPELLNQDLLRSNAEKPVIDLTPYLTDKALKTDSATSKYRIIFKVRQTETIKNIWQKVQELGETIHPLSCRFNVYMKRD